MGDKLNSRWRPPLLYCYTVTVANFAKIRHFRPTSTKFCTQGRIPDIFLDLEFQKDRLKMWEQSGVKFLAFPLTWHIAYTTACCYRTSRDHMEVDSIVGFL